MPARFVLAIPTLQEFGCFDYIATTLQEAQVWLRLGPYYSAIRSRDLCRAFYEVTGQTLYPLSNMQMPSLAPGEDALVFYVPPSDSARSIRDMTVDYMVANYQLGLLKRVDVVTPDDEATHATEELMSVSVVEQGL